MDYYDIPEPIDNINQIVDFVRLRRCNDLCWKWAQRLGVKQHDYIRFAVRMRNDLEGLKNQLEVRYRCQFVKDCKVMFYAMEVEEILVKQYTAMIFSIYRRLRIPQNEHEELITEGLVAIRNAVWHFRNISGAKASFTTFCYNSIMLRIRGIRIKDYRKRQRRDNLAYMNNSSDMSEKFSFDVFPKDYSQNLEEFNPSSEIDSILELCKLTEKEIYLIRSFMSRFQCGNFENRPDGHWYDNFIQKFPNPRFNTNYSRQGVYNQLVRVQMKILYIMKKHKKVDQKFELPLSLKQVAH
jgi:hypothetical protein